MKKTISGIRGIVGDDLGPADVTRFCSGFASLIGEECVTGMDTRPSGPMISYAAHAALMAGGVDVYKCGVAPTPVIFRESRSKKAGLVVTSSHNPLDWNGLKFIINGRGINEGELASIVGREGAEHMTHGTTENGMVDRKRTGIQSPTADRSNLDDRRCKPGREHECTTLQYVKDAAEIIGRVEKSTRVAVDIGGGATADIVPDLLGAIGCSTTVINADPASCNRGPDPTTDKLEDLAGASLDSDIGFAFDLDGDRLVIVRNGTKESPDTTLGLGVAMALDMGRSRFVISTDTSAAVEKIIVGEGGRCTRSKVGEANVVEEMRKVGAQAGGEGSSGGFIPGEFNYCRDGILASGLISCLLSNERRLKEVLDYMNEYYTIRTKMSVDSALHGGVMDRAEEWMGTWCSEIDRLDGLKGIVDEDSWVLIRGSNTENVIRISAESASRDRCDRIVKRITEAMAGGA